MLKHHSKEINIIINSTSQSHCIKIAQIADMLILLLKKFKVTFWSCSAPVKNPLLVLFRSKVLFNCSFQEQDWSKQVFH